MKASRGLPTFLVVAAIGVFVAISVLVGLMVWYVVAPGEDLDPILQSQGLVISLLGVSASILVSGVAVAVPLYISLWGQAGDNLFSLYMRTLDQWDNENVSKQHLGDSRRKLLKEILELNDNIEPARRLLTLALRGAILEIIILITIMALPGTYASFVLAYFAIFLSLALAFVFFFLVHLIQRTGPVKRQIEMQKEILEIFEEGCSDG